MAATPLRKIAIIGFGEVGGIFGLDLSSAGAEISVCDLLFAQSQRRPAMLQKAKDTHVTHKESIHDLVQGAELVISAVNGSSAIGAAKEAAKSLKQGQIYMDLNSISPENKRIIAAEIGRSPADFVEATVMAQVKANRIKVPILLAGRRAAELSEKLNALGMKTEAIGGNIGAGAAIKMCRSIVIKGMAALVVECLFAAHKYGAEEAVLASIDATYPGMGWKDKLPTDLVFRAIEHSRRRASEMRESANTLMDAGFTPRMALATAELQDWLTEEMEAHNLTPKSIEPFSWQAFADAIAVEKSEKKTV